MMVDIGFTPDFLTLLSALNASARLLTFYGAIYEFFQKVMRRKCAIESS